MRPVRKSCLSAGLSAVILLAATACASSHATSGSGATLVLAEGASTSGVDPVTAQPAAYDFPAYDPLIYKTADGSYVPDLAVSWGYVGTGNRVFQLTLRKGARFSDGSPVDAVAVVASLRYFLQTNGPNLANAGPVSSVTASGSRTVQIRYRTPYADAVVSLTQDKNFGLVIGPKGLADPASLTDSTDGAGQYVLDPSQTTINTVYTFTPDRYYFNQAAIKYTKIQLRPYASQPAQFNALESGQADFASNLDASDVAAGRAANLQVSTGPALWSSLMLEDRASGPLKSQLVRTALQHAIDRDAIVKAVYNGEATPQSQVAIRGTSGYLPAEDNKYAYDPALARRLLEQAGYPDGFSLSVLDNGLLDPGGVLASAVASQLAPIGVKLAITNTGTSFSDFNADLAARKFQSVIFPLKADTMFYEAGQILPVQGSIANAYGLSDPQANALYASASSASTAAAQTGYLQRLNERLDSLAWVAPIALIDSIQMTASSVKNVPATFKTTDLDPFSPVTSQNWYSA